MITVGIDMASRPERTAACRLQWQTGHATILEVKSGVTDQNILDLLRDPPDKIGIDVPLGWPTEFVDAVSRHARGRPFGTASQRELAYRATDRNLGESGQGWPLSVSADRLAYPAMRAARLLGALDRSGQGAVVEVYPAVALRRWGLPHRSYKGLVNRRLLEELLTALRAKAPWLTVTSHQWTQLTNDDNCADALIASLVARSAVLGRCDPVPPDQLERARREGWIAVPQADGLGQLGAVPG